MEICDTAQSSSQSALLAQTRPRRMGEAMARAPSYTAFVPQQITLRDVYARVEEFRLDVDELIAEVLDEPSGDREVDFVEALTWSGLQGADVGEMWKMLGAKIGNHLAHAANDRWTGFATVVRESARYRAVRVIQPVGVRTLSTLIEKTGWDYRRMPSVSQGAEGTLDGLVGSLCRVLEFETVGGLEYLRSDDEAPVRALTVLATTLATVLLDDVARISDPHARARVTRPDIFEKAVVGAGLGSFFQVIRRLVEIDHDEHLVVQDRDFGFLEYRSRRKEHLEINETEARKWLDPTLYT
jgi:hypothetical protein